MKVLVTGSAGFIGSALSIQLLKRGDQVIGIDNHNNYYDPVLKEDRLTRHVNHENYTHLRIDLTDRSAMEKVFSEHKPEGVINMAAQAGVRYSIENPLAYVDSNLVGFAHILEGCRNNKVEHLVYASSSSVYGSNTNIPSSVQDNVDYPLSLYAASKKSNELMAHAYSHLFDLHTTGLRLFTVYGPWGRPDMALFKFTKAILSDKPIQVFNYGKHLRDFTFIDDIVEGVIRVLDNPPTSSQDKLSSNNITQHTRLKPPYSIYNLGNSVPVRLLNFIEILEEALGIKANKEMLPLQPGDVKNTFAEVEDLVKQFDYKPSTTVEEGISKFINWYNYYYKT